MGPEVSIVIPVLNQRALTEQCINSLTPDLRAGAQVIIIDNGSEEETRDYLRSVPGIELLRNDTNRGCAPAWNQGVERARGSWIVVLNNDVRAASGWLQGLASYAVNNKVDIVTPGMREGPLNYDFEPYARDYMTRLRAVERRGVANGVCFMVNRRVFEAVGGFDEAFRIGQFEDTDFFWRADRAGFRLGTTGASFLHHFGSATQAALRESKPADAYEAENRRRFREKWRLTGWKRFWQRTGRQARGRFWSARERLRYGHTLYEKWIDGRLHFE